MSNNKVILSTYREIIELVKTNIITDLQVAFSEGTLTIDEEELPRLFQLIQTLVEQYGANGYEQLQRVCATAAPTKRKRK